jgi:hypothetical protein
MTNSAPLPSRQDRAVALTQDLRTIAADLAALDQSVTVAASEDRQDDLCGLAESAMALHVRFAFTYRSLLVARQPPGRPLVERASV